jgi:hypothetical protein
VSAGTSRAKGLLAEDAALFSNRGRWGGAEPPCALRFVTPSRVAMACGLVRRGHVVSCALPRTTPAPPEATARLAAAGVLTAPIVARGVLLDLARMAGRPWLPDGTEAGPELLDECAEAEGVALEPGDAVLVRTGLLSACAGLGEWEGYGQRPAPGLSPRCARWLYEREIALVAADTPFVEAVRELEAARRLRAVSLEHTGVVFGENFHLDALGEACAADGDYAFLFVCPASQPEAAAAPFAVK